MTYSVLSGTLSIYTTATTTTTTEMEELAAVRILCEKVSFQMVFQRNKESLMNNPLQTVGTAVGTK